MKSGWRTVIVGGGAVEEDRNFHHVRVSCCNSIV